MNHEHTSKLHRLRTLHLFAGAGGGILSDILLGHQPVCAVEIEPYCQQVLHARQKDGFIPWFPIFDDVKTFDGKPWRGLVEVVAGGFPCQDISSAGKGVGISGERSGLWREMARVVCEVRPRYVFVENSPMLTIRGLGVVLRDLAAMGYDAKWCVLGACDAGAPHKRERIWILGYAKGIGRTGGEIHAGNIIAALRGRPTDSTLATDTRSKNVADANGERMEIGGRDIATAGASGRGSVDGGNGGGNGGGNIAPGADENMADSDRPQRQGTRQPYGITSQHAEPLQSSSWWGHDPAEAPKSDVGRVANGVASRVDRLKAIGNGQVPQVAALAWRILSEGII